MLCDPDDETYKDVLMRSTKGRWKACTYCKQDTPEILVDDMKLSANSELTSLMESISCHMRRERRESQYPRSKNNRLRS